MKGWTMNRMIQGALGGLLVGAAGLLGTTSAFATGGGHDPVVICHKGDTIVIDDSAWPGHKAHGDSKGQCAPKPCPTVTVEVPGPETTKTVLEPGPTETATVVVTQTAVATEYVPGPEVTVTATETAPAPTVTVPGPETTITVPGPETTITATAEPAPTVTITETATAEVLVPGDTKTVTAQPKPLNCPVPTEELAQTGSDAGAGLMMAFGMGVGGGLLMWVSRRPRGAHE